MGESIFRIRRVDGKKWTRQIFISSYIKYETEWWGKSKSIGGETGSFRTVEQAVRSYTVNSNARPYEIWEFDMDPNGPSFAPRKVYEKL